MFALCRHFNLDKSSVEHFRVQEMIMHGKNPNTFYVSFDLAKEFKILLGNINTKKVFITAKHLTTLSDEGSALKKYGLLNLKDVLEKDTPLNQFLQVKNIKFNIDKKKIRKIIQNNSQKKNNRKKSSSNREIVLEKTL